MEAMGEESSPVEGSQMFLKEKVQFASFVMNSYKIWTYLCRIQGNSAPADTGVRSKDMSLTWAWIHGYKELSICHYTPLKIWAGTTLSEICKAILASTYY